MTELVMHLDKPANITNFIGSLLKEEAPDMRVFYSLDLVPEVASESQIQSLLIKHLGNNNPAIRRYSARILAKKGYHEGVLHLIYNALSKHPILGSSQHSDYHDIRRLARHELMPYADKLTEACLQILINEILQFGKLDVCDVLIAAPRELVLEMLHPYLNHGKEHMRLAAGFVFAMHKNNSGREALMRAITSKSYLIPSITALSHIADDEIIKLLYQLSIDKTYGVGSCIPSYLSRSADFRYQLLTHQQTTLDLFKSHFYKPFPKYEVDGKIPSFFICWPRWNNEDINLIDMLAEFGTSEEQGACVDLQHENISLACRSAYLTGRNPGEEQKFMVNLPLRGKCLPGIVFYLSNEDFAEAATCWLRNPEKYRAGYF